MADNTNIGYAFPLEKLGSDIARNNYNYQSILNGLIEWNNSTEDVVNIRLTKDTDPYYEDYQIPSKKSVLDAGSLNATVNEAISANYFVTNRKLDTAVYGGSKQFVTTGIDTSTGVDISTDIITLTDGTEFEVADEIKIEPDTGSTLPTPLSATTPYFVIAKPTANEIQISETLNGSAVDITVIGSGTLTVTKLPSVYAVDEDDPGDTITFRNTVTDSGNAVWELYYAIAMQDWTSGTSYKATNVVKYTDNKYYVLRYDIDNSTVDPSTDTANFEEYIKVWSSGVSYLIGDFVEDDLTGNLYIVTDNNLISSTPRPSSNPDRYELYAYKYVNLSNYNAGRYVYESGRLFLAVTNIINSTVTPSADTTGSWEEVILRSVPTANPFTQSSVFRWMATLNTSYFILRNVSTIASDDTTDVNIRISVKTPEPASIYQRTVDTFPTSNFSFWPQDNNSIWSQGVTYGPTDTSISITKRQDYSAVMFFDHTRPDIAKTVNYVNYDGPDLDQGLCIYLPVEIEVGDGGIARPEDGFTYEFFFRIWPTVGLNNATTRDHIVNKSQIYVYSALDRDTVTSDTCEEPIAKFSMARTTNFYMFGENVSVPDKPVCYRATFKYSEADQKWCLFDYYQLPDHIFVGPVGFIDPQNPANLDINDEVIGNINPNAMNIGYETAAFPMFQDPFSNVDLTPYRISGDDIDDFKNRIVQ